MKPSFLSFIPFPFLCTMSKIKNIIFDLGGVLLNIDYHLTKKAFQNLGVANFDELYSQAAANELFSQLEKGDLTPNEFYRQFNDFTGHDFTAKQISTAWNAMLLDFRESSLKYLRTLKPKANLLLLSNTNAIHLKAFHEIYYQKEREHSFEDLFHHCIYSFETGTRKPDVECYQWVMRNTGIRASESLFIDDSPQNVVGAEKAGIRSLLLEKNSLIENLGLEKILETGL